MYEQEYLKYKIRAYITLKVLNEQVRKFRKLKALKEMLRRSTNYADEGNYNSRYVLSFALWHKFVFYFWVVYIRGRKEVK